MSKNKIPLEPCPFCGGRASIIKDILNFYVACTNCRAGAVYCVRTREEAAQNWNVRISPVEPTTEQDNTTLKPCPFCGGRASIIKGILNFYVACTNCRASTAYCVRTREEAAQNWDVRISPATPVAPPVPPAVGVEADGGAGSVEEMSEKLNELNDGGESK